MSEESTTLSVTDLQLLQNWTLEAYKGFGDTAEEESFWQTGLPQLAFAHPFLMHSILAISSLHLARHSTNDEARFQALAATHQDLALPAYRYVISDMQRSIDEEKGRAMVAFASLTVVYAMLRPRPEGIHGSGG